MSLKPQRPTTTRAEALIAECYPEVQLTDWQLAVIRRTFPDLDQPTPDQPLGIVHTDCEETP